MKKIGTIKITTAIIFIILAIALAIMIYFLIIKKNHTKIVEVNFVDNDLPTNGSLVGLWSSFIGCDGDSFHLVALATALPQEYLSSTSNASDFDLFFSKNIRGTYKSTLSTSSKKYIISVGGSAASTEGWTSFFNELNSKEGITRFINACVCRGISGIDLDLEQTTSAHVPIINSIVELIKTDDDLKFFIVQYTILLGSPSTYAGLFANDYYDYVALMLYNGGMYDTGDNIGPSGNCSWDQWAELFLTKGASGCVSPLKEPASTFATTANLANINTNKIMLALIIDNKTNAVSGPDVTTAKNLINQYKCAGYYIWVLPGFVGGSLSPQKNLDTLSGFGLTVSNISACNTDSPSAGCPKVKVPCDTTTAKENCVATSCAMKAYSNFTSEQCAPCAGENPQTWWPCNIQGMCEVKGTGPPPAPGCSDYISKNNYYLIGKVAHSNLVPGSIGHKRETFLPY